MEPARREVEKQFNTITVHPSKISFVSNVTATEITETSEITETMVRQ